MLPLGVDVEPVDKQLVELQALQDYRVFAATTIQRFVRGYQCRRRLAHEVGLHHNGYVPLAPGGPYINAR
jgi:hypothetical protein